MANALGMTMQILQTQSQLYFPFCISHHFNLDIWEKIPETSHFFGDLCDRYDVFSCVLTSISTSVQHQFMRTF